MVCFPNSHIHKVTKLQLRKEEAETSPRDGDQHGDTKRLKTTHDATNAAKAQGILGEPKKVIRRIVVFWLVDPTERIVSTANVDPQQVSMGGSMKLEDAKQFRLEMMEERKRHKQSYNVREVSLCEH